MDWLRRKTNDTAEPAAAGRLAGLEADSVNGLESDAFRIGSGLWDKLSQQRRTSARPGSWRQGLMEWVMADPAFKVQMFRLVDVFPTLKDPELAHRVLTDYLTQPGVHPPTAIGYGVRAGGLAKRALLKAVGSQIEAMARSFIAGRDAASALPRLGEWWEAGMGFSLDLLGETCVSDAEAEAYQHRYLDLADRLPQATAAWPDAPGLMKDHLGPIPRCNVSIKVSALSARINEADFDGSVDRLFHAVRPILDAAAARGVFINFDMEHHALKDLTLALFMRCCESIDFDAGIALQAYLRCAEDDAERLINWSKSVGRQVTVRLIKGAYWDQETIHAEQMGWPVPVWSRKRDTDACFERIAQRLLRSTPRSADESGVKLALGSHNLRSIAWAKAVLRAEGLPPSALEYQMLEGMAGDLKRALVENGDRVRVYAPVGELIPGMAYLVRRLLENTSNESWLLSSRGARPSPESLLASPHDHPEDASEDPGIVLIRNAPERHQLSEAQAGVGDGRPFMNEPWRDFSDAAQRQAFALAIQRSEPPEVPHDGTEADAADAVSLAVEASGPWSDADARGRAQRLNAAADAIAAQRDALAGLIIREAGKTWREADADVCEAIDFCRFYSREAVGLFEPQRLGAYIGELNHHWHQPVGVAAVISPWNFPLAICAGMTSAALACGNTVIVKPAEQTPGVALRMCEIFWDAGVPHEALQLLPGVGHIVGAALVRDPRVGVVAFTGSREVGFDISAAAGEVREGQHHLKRLVCEMGGKNAIIVDETADLDEAVLGVRQSAFSYAGQKCSACSRVIVVGSTFDSFQKRFIDATASLTIGDPMDPGTDVGPLIDTEAFEKVMRCVEHGKTEASLAYAGSVPTGLAKRVGKPYAPPHVFADVQPDHRLANEEIFGPVLAVMRAADFRDALKIANQTPYRLTGGVYSRTPSHLEEARRRFRVGNLYLNRGCTGALVGRQPFGGFGHSGGGAKAGGREYLLHFVHPRACTENTMRRGFAPGLD